MHSLLYHPTIAPWLSGIKVSELNPLVTGLSPMCDRSRSSEQNDSGSDVSFLLIIRAPIQVLHALAGSQALDMRSLLESLSMHETSSLLAFCSEERLRSHMGLKHG